MAAPRKSNEPSNVEQLREEIDKGEFADKVDYTDPAAAPLGSDDEAAGNPPRADEVSKAIPPHGKSLHEKSRPAILAYVAIAVFILVVFVTIVINATS